MKKINVNVIVVQFVKCYEGVYVNDGDKFPNKELSTLIDPGNEIILENNYYECPRESCLCEGYNYRVNKGRNCGEIPLCIEEGLEVYLNENGICPCNKGKENVCKYKAGDGKRCKCFDNVEIDNDSECPYEKTGSSTDYECNNMVYLTSSNEECLCSNELSKCYCYNTKDGECTCIENHVNVRLGGECPDLSGSSLSKGSNIILTSTTYTCPTNECVCKMKNDDGKDMKWVIKNGMYCNILLVQVMMK